MSQPGPAGTPAHPPAHPPARVRVTAPASTRRRPRAGIARQLDEQTALGDLYLRSLMRSQLRLALALTAVLALSVGLLPVLFLLVPGLRSARLGFLADAPVPWLLLGGLTYPVLLALAVTFVRRAERNERRFVDLVDDTTPDPPDPDPNAAR